MLGMGKLAVGLVAVPAAALVTAGTGTAAAERGADGHLYAAYAVSTDNLENQIVVGVAWNYPDQAAADRGAQSKCGYGNCEILLRFRDGCGALAERDNQIRGAGGPVAQDAERAALAAFGPERPPSLSAAGSHTRLLGNAQCNG